MVHQTRKTPIGVFFVLYLYFYRGLHLCVILMSPYPGGFLCYLAVFSFFGFQHGFLDIFNGDLAAVTREVIANHDLIFIDIHRIDEGIDQALRISDVRPVTFCNIGEVVEDLFFIKLFLYKLPLGYGKVDILQFASLFLILAAMVGDEQTAKAALPKMQDMTTEPQG